MASKNMSLFLTAVMLSLAFDCGNCNSQKIENSQSVVDHGSRSIHRFRRVPLRADKQEVLDAHNRVRRMEGASNMVIMTWNNVLEGIANGWVDDCIWGRSHHTSLGENRYAINMSFSINLTEAVLAWYDERKSYNYETLACNAGQRCDNYTQVVWAASTDVGCGYTICPILKNQSTYINATYFVCYYVPAGNVKDVKPFLKGTPCSNCSTGSAWCNDGLCDRSCNAAGQTCACARICHNSGTLNSATCECSCTDGWFGSDCSVTEFLAAKSHSTVTQSSVLSMLVVWLSGVITYSFRSI